jgi:group II intron reverse transcriptase/maturase
MGETLSSQTVSSKLQRIAQQARDYPDSVFTTLAHLIDVDFLREAHRRVNKKGGPGIDKVTAQAYGSNLEENLADLHGRLRQGKYQAPPVARKWMEKENGKLRPIGKPTFEDKIVQRAVEMLLSAVYEEEFYDFSHGFRKGRSQHQALHSLRENCRLLNINRILNADITGLFDNIGHKQLLDLVRRRVNDGAIIRLIGKWLNAGVMEEDRLEFPDRGTPQGGVISPLLSNIFLHAVLDDWFAREVQPRMSRRCFIIRWADDFIIGFELESDARKVMEVLPKRFARYGLELHPDKTSMIRFGKPPSTATTSGENGTFNFLGFTFYWGKGLKGYWVIKKKTVGKRLRGFLKRTWLWCKENRHEAIGLQHRILSSKLRGFYQYYGVRGNFKALEVAFEYAYKAWRRWLSRRDQRGVVLFEYLQEKYPLPQPRIVHNI